jgi:hypothetical protein
MPSSLRLKFCLAWHALSTVLIVRVQMNTETIPPKFMRPRPYCRRVGVNWRTGYRYIDEGLWPAYKFQGVLLLDVDEIDGILKGLPTPASKGIAANRRRQSPKSAKSAVVKQGLAKHLGQKEAATAE